jgi:hypothetical protein
VRLEFGKLLMPEEIAAMDERQILAECTARLTALDAEARRVRNHALPRKPDARARRVGVASDRARK